MDNSEIIKIVWETLNDNRDRFYYETEKILQKCVNNILRKAMVNKSEDNISVLILFLKDFKDIFK